MDTLSQEMTELHRNILETDEGSRHLMHSQLSSLLNRMKMLGHEIPKDVLRLNEDLANDAIEAQFDNMPV